MKDEGETGGRGEGEMRNEGLTTFGEILSPPRPFAPSPIRPPLPVSVVIPCRNEAPGIPQLVSVLMSVQGALAREYALTFIVVDDGSEDATWARMTAAFGDNPSFVLLRHRVNRGVAAAIRTGLRAAETDIVCSIDADCTYDPHELRRMIPLLIDGVDLVTASPYHPRGAVRNVPPWRLALSKTASRLYRLVLRQQLHTYTSCFRVYRRCAVLDLPLRDGGFVGVAEMLGRLDLRGSRIVECPATLDVRRFGRSKMKLVRAIAGHLRLLTWLAVRRLFARSSPERAGTLTQPRGIVAAHRGDHR